MRVVLDTNVLIAGLLSPHGPAARLLDLALAGELELLLDDRILAEYREVAARPAFGFVPGDVNRVLDALEALGEHVTAAPLNITLPDADDMPFVEVAASGRADALVTGNTRHFIVQSGHHKIRILTPRALLDVLRRGQ